MEILRNTVNRVVRVLTLYKIIDENSTIENPIGTTEIREELAKATGVLYDRRSIYSDIDLLNSCGIEVCCVRSRSNVYYTPKDFDLAELVYLTDAIQASHFLTEERSRALIDKISKLSGKYNKEVIKRSVKETFSYKTDNATTLYNIDIINDAISNGKKISFNYFNYDENRNKVYKTLSKKDPTLKLYRVNPVATLVDNDNYYLIATTSRSGKFRHFRVDRMDNVVKTNLKMRPKDESFEVDLQQYRRDLINMYHGNKQEFECEVDSELIGVVYDKFGKDIETEKISDNIIKCKLECQISPPFYAWACSLGNKLKITAPEKLVNDVKDYIKSVLKEYED